QKRIDSFIKSSEILLDNYNGYLKSIARKYFLESGSIEDLEQEAKIGFYEAIRDYDENKDIKFSSFLYTCANRKIQTAIRDANRKKHEALNRYVSIDKDLIDVYDENDSNAKNRTESITDPIKNPEDEFINKAREKQTQEYIRKNLNKKEKEVLHYFLQGYKYKEIADRLNIKEKNVDNTIFKIRKKLSFLKKF
ncbi:MAG: sigma-70 family RNA polymerase sigma factor, partial [Candidatus Woesearchaeota archaeon]